MSSYSAYSGNGLDQIDPFDAGDHNIWRKAEYLGRYLFAADFLRPHKPDIVADISCGMGYGAAELCGVAGRVIGVDGDRALMESARQKFKMANLHFLHKDLDEEELSPEIEEGSAAALVSFETLEHLLDPYRAVAQFSKILQPGGFFICSVPNVLSESGDNAGLPRNKSHKQWFNFASLSRMVAQNGMHVVYRMGQSWSKSLFRREQQLSNARRLTRKLGDEPIMQTPKMIRWLSYVAAYPTVEDVDGSYSIIIVAQKE
ncbi:MAG: class I SAM-dependent methyltransferase [Methanothrix sp.]|jgi:SAM-dependent methyltransferase|nr:class I SAM-dependent methyltransferase [Methanothrix sp.]